MEHDYILSIEDLSLGFRNNKAEDDLAVHGLNFSIPYGKTFVLVGESGSGKSVTAHAVLQLLPDNVTIDQKSKILFAGSDLLAKSEYEMQHIRGNQIAMVFQDPMTSLNPVLTIGEQIFETVKLHSRLGFKQAKEHVITLLELVGIDNPQHRYYQYPHELSGGQKQRIVIAIALAGKPKLLIADEPTTALDVTTQAQILSLLRKIQQDYQLSILLITHDIGVAALMGDIIGVMYAGHLVEVNYASNIVQDPKHPYTQELIQAIPNLNKSEQLLNVTIGNINIQKVVAGCRFVERCPLKINICYKNSPEFYYVNNSNVRCHLFNSEFMSVKKITRAFSEITALPSRSNIPAENILQVRDLSVQYNTKKRKLFSKASKITAVNQVSLQLTKGRTLAIVGESGSGKTSAGKAILDLIAKSAGKIYLYDVYLDKIHKKFRKKLQIVFQDVYSSLNPKLTIRDIILEGLLLFEKKPAIIETKLKKVLSQVGLTYEVLSRYPHQFSGGQRQRIAIARSLILSPDLIVLDEPTSSLDVSIQAQILNLLKTIQRENDFSYILISHDLSVVGYMADEVMVMYQGKVLEHGTVHEIFNNPQHPYTKALLSSVPEQLQLNNIPTVNVDNYKITLSDYNKEVDIDTNIISFSKTHRVYYHEDFNRL